MHNRLDILRVPPSPMSSPLYVYKTNTSEEVILYYDRELTRIQSQPILMNTTNIHFYCEENIRVDIKIISDIYPAGFILIKDQLMINQDSYLDRIYTFNDTSNVVDNIGNILTGEI